MIPGGATGGLEPGMLIRRVVDDELGDDADPPPVRRLDEAIEVVHRAVGRMDILVVGDVVAIVFERRWIKGQQPERVDAEIFKVSEPAGQTRKVADAVGRRIDKSAHVRLVDDRLAIPVRVRTSRPDFLRHVPAPLPAPSALMWPPTADDWVRWLTTCPVRKTPTPTGTLREDREDSCGCVNVPGRSAGALLKPWDYRNSRPSSRRRE